MIESIITLLIYVCLLALVVYLIIWVLGVIGVPLPEKVIQIIWVIVALIVVLMILQTILPRFGVKIALVSEAIAQQAPQKRTVLIPAAPRPLPAQPESIPLAAVPPLLVLYDLNRRINCLVPPDPLGLGGPGFDGKPLDPAKGNVMIPCWQRRAGGSPTPTR